MIHGEKEMRRFGEYAFMAARIRVIRIGDGESEAENRMKSDSKVTKSLTQKH